MLFVQKSLYFSGSNPSSLVYMNHINRNVESDGISWIYIELLDQAKRRN